MNNKRICELAAGWEQATYNIFHDRTVKLQEIEENLRNTYRICTEYHNKEMVPKEMIRLFKEINRFLEYLKVVYDIDELSTPSDSAVYNAIGFVIDEIEEGFYNGKYECKFPYIEVYDSNVNTHLLDVEGDFLELLIDANR